MCQSQVEKLAAGLNSLCGGPARLYEGTRGQIQGAIDALGKRAMQSGDIRKELEPFDPPLAL